MNTKMFLLKTVCTRYISKNYKIYYLKTPMVLVDAYYSCASEAVDG